MEYRPTRDRKTMSDTYERRLAFEGAMNFRDLGGYPAADGRRTRWRRLFRADSLGDLTPRDLARIGELGLRGLIDFRIEAERRLKPDRLPEDSGVRTLELGFLPAGTLDMLARVRARSITTAELEREVLGHYRLFVRDHASEYRQAVLFASDPTNYPLLIHCTSGKDRTGVAAAILLLAVGVPRETVLQDYDLTNHYRRDVSHLFGPNTPPEVISLLLSAPSHYLEAALDEMEQRFGSFSGYLEKGLGVDDAARARLVELMTEGEVVANG
jgi:protein-tyrosine phosphatase